MFEHQEKEVEVMMQNNAEFRSLYHLHKELDGKVRDAELGVLPMDDITLHKMKKEKLHAKDKLIHMWEGQQTA
ncbi:MAG: YdcH family protein [Rhodanobacteraceae bacterium]